MTRINTGPAPDDALTRVETIIAMTPTDRQARRTAALAEMAELELYSRRSNAQNQQLEALENELLDFEVADRLINERKREALRSAAGTGRNAEPGDGHSALAGTGKRTRNGGPDPTVITRHRTAAFEGVTGRESYVGMPFDESLRRNDAALEMLSTRGVPQDGIDRLADLIAAPDRDELGEDLYPLAVAQRAHAAAQNLALADPTYERAFQKILRNPTSFVIDLTDDERHAVMRTRGFQRDLAGNGHDWQSQPMSYADGTVSNRAALSLSTASAGYMLPLFLDPSIILINAGAANPWRRWATIKQTTSNTWNGVNSAGVSANWLAENTIVTDNTPTVNQIQITPFKAAAWVYGSYEVLEDTDFANQLPVLLGDAKNRLEEAAFATGTGSGQPFGVVTRATATAIGGGTITAAGVYSLHQALAARYRVGRQAWFANVSGQDTMRQLPIFTSALTPMLQGDQMTPFGETCYESTTVDGTISTGGHKVLVYADANNYIVADRIGMSLIYEPLVKGTGGILPGGQGGWYAFWRVGADSTSMGTSPAIRNLTLT